MKQARRKTARRPKATTRYAVPAHSKRGGDFDVLHAAHRAQMAAVVAGRTAEELRTVAQVMGLAADTNKRRKGALPPNVLDAISKADDSLATQIGILEQFATKTIPGPVAIADAATYGATLAQHRTKCRSAVKVSVPRELPPVSSIEGDLVEIAFAMVSNGCDAVAPRRDGQVKVTAAVDESVVKIIVEDNGPGLAPGIKRRLFEPLLTTRDDGQHLGIGLSVSRQLARRNGGDLVHQNVPGGGARFVLSLPRWDSLRPVGRRARG